MESRDDIGNLGGGVGDFITKETVDKSRSGRQLVVSKFSNGMQSNISKLFLTPSTLQKVWRNPGCECDYVFSCPSNPDMACHRPLQTLLRTLPKWRTQHGICGHRPLTSLFTALGGTETDAV